MTDTAIPEGFVEYKTLNPELFPEGVPEEKQHRLYLATRQANKIPEPKVSAGNVFVPQPKREWIIDVKEKSLHDMTSIALDALSDVNEPQWLFSRSRSLVRINYDELGLPLVEGLNEHSLKGILDRCATFQTTTNPTGNNPMGITRPVSPPKDVVMDLLNLPEWISIKPLAGIIECPYLTLDNKLVADQGYNPQTKLYYAPPNGFISPSLPEVPTEGDVKKSVELLDEIIKDFPFKTYADRTMAIAALFTIVLRPIIEGNVPMGLINKPSPGTGASLLCESFVLISTGKSAPVITAPVSEEEWKKKILSTLQMGRSFAIVDNLENKFYSPTFAALLTAKLWEDRVLGVSKNATLPHRMCWLGNGNCIQLGGDLPRRCYMINMDALSARPWQRDPSTFTHQNLLEWILENRSRIIKAILVLERNWILQGKPKPTSEMVDGKEVQIPEMGGFEEWRHIIGGILKSSGYKGFLSNLEKMYESSDVDGMQWDNFVQRWYSLFKEEPQTVAGIITYMNRFDDTQSSEYKEENGLLTVLPDVLVEAWEGKKSFSRVVGNQLSKHAGRVYSNDLRIVKGETAHSAITWIVQKIERPNNSGELANTLFTDGSRGVRELR